MHPPNDDEYCVKLLKSFDLILNHTVDNRDDTIILKLIDQLKTLLNDSLYSNIISYITLNIFKDPFLFVQKDPEVQLFFINLIKLIVQFKHNIEFEQNVQKLIECFIDNDFYEHDSGTLCAIFDLSTTFKLNDKIIQYFFKYDTVHHFVDPGLRSVYVRRHFKTLLSIYAQEPKVKTVLSSLPDDVKIPNLDLYYTCNLTVSDLESNVGKLDLNSIQYFSYFVVQNSIDIHTILVKLESITNRYKHDIIFKFLIYAFEKGNETVLYEFFTPFKLRDDRIEFVFKHFCHNFNLFVKKFGNKIELSDFVDPKDVLYVLKSVSLNEKTKRLIVQSLNDYFEQKLNEKDLRFVRILNEEFKNVFEFKIDGVLSIEILKFYHLENRDLSDLDININNQKNFEILIEFLGKSNTGIYNEQILTKCMSLLTDCEDLEIKETILEYLSTLSDYESEVFNEQNLYKIQLLCLGESEAFLRREYLKFLSKFYQSSTKVIEYFSYVLINDHDWQCQLYCLDYFNKVVSLSNEQSNIITSLFKVLDDSDNQVVKFACEILIGLKKDGVKLNTCKVKFNFIHKMKDDLTEIYSKEIAVTGAEEIDTKNDQIDLEYLLKLSSLTSDIYVLHKTAILDDILSAYQFDWDDEKGVDCY